ncbi:hypothetical protein [Nocardioides sp.]|uniref:hypothetical protein n=1 Tax=Nocardioides sp. TaxID=35761 RepID=UPI002ED79F53
MTLARHAGRDRVLVGGTLLIVAAVGFRTWAAAQTWFYVDDFPIVATAAHDGIGPRALVEPYIGHVMPAGRVAAWLTTVGRPYDYPVAIAELMVLFALASAGLLRLLRTLFGPHPAVLLLLAYFLASPWLISLTSWWAAGINHLPALVATVWATDAAVRYLREPRGRDLAASIAWVCFGLAFAELALLAYLPLVLISVCYFATGSLAERIRHLWRTRRPLVVGHGLVVAAYSAIYLATAWSPQDAPDGGVPWREYFVNVLGTVVPSAAIGGPVRWHQVWAAQFDVDPPTIVRLAGLLAVAGVFSLAALTRDRALRAWSIPLAQLLVLVALMAKTRVVFGPSFILDLRFTTPLAVGIPLAIGLAFLPVRDALEGSERRQPHWLVDRPAPALLATAVVVALSVRSAATFPLLHVPQEESPRAYFAALEHDLDEHEGPVDLVDDHLPGYVFSGPEGVHSIALSQYGDRVRFPTVLQDEFYVVDQSGHLVEPDLDVARRSGPPPRAGGCTGHLVDGGTRGVIPLDGPVFGAVWRLRIEYTASTATPVRITRGEATTEASLLDGTHLIELSGAGQYESIGVAPTDPGAQVCVHEVEVGTTSYPGRPPIG